MGSEALLIAGKEFVVVGSAVLMIEAARHLGVPPWALVAIGFALLLLTTIS